MHNSNERHCFSFCSCHTFSRSWQVLIAFIVYPCDMSLGIKLTDPIPGCNVADTATGEMSSSRTSTSAASGATSTAFGRPPSPPRPGAQPASSPQPSSGAAPDMFGSTSSLHDADGDGWHDSDGDADAQVASWSVMHTYVVKQPCICHQAALHTRIALAAGVGADVLYSNTADDTCHDAYQHHAVWSCAGLVHRRLKCLYLLTHGMSCC